MQKIVPNFEGNSESEGTMRSAIYLVDSVPLHYIQAPGKYQNDPGIKEVSNTSAIELDCRFWHFCFQWTKISCKVDYRAESLMPPVIHGGMQWKMFLVCEQNR